MGLWMKITESCQQSKNLVENSKINLVQEFITWEEFESIPKLAQN
jgi:hypothetical protein